MSIQDNNSTYGLLQKFCVRERNAETAIEAHQNGYNEWGYKTWDELRGERDDVIHKNAEGVITPRQIEDGSYIRIFNTIAAGDVLWKGELSLEFNRRQRSSSFNPEYSQQEIFGMWVHGLQATLDPDEWAIMFFQGLPAILTRDNKEIHGALEPFFETGTEGVIWSLAEYGKSGFDGLYILKNGDDLCVYDNVTDGSVDWEGEIRLASYESPYRFYTDAGDQLGDRLVRFPHNPGFREMRDFFHQRLPFALQPS